MNRRKFLRNAGAGLAGMGFAAAWPFKVNGRSRAAARELSADVVIVGGGVGGFAAALAAARNGMRVIMTEETDWIGGQLTQQIVPPDEHPWIEQFGAPQSYRSYRMGVREFYRRYYPLAAHGYQSDRFNPGNCGVSRICHEPHVSLAVLQGMLAPYVSSGRLTILTEYQPVSASVTGDRVEAVRVRGLDGEEVDLTAPFFIDATELGDLLPLTGTEYVTGAESQAQTGELHAPSEADPLNMQAITWCFAMDYLEGEDHTIERPPDYDFWRSYIPELTPAWPGPLLSLTYSHPATLNPRTLPFDPRNGAEDPGWWRYRRLADPGNFAPGVYSGGITLVNWPQNDYLLGNIFEVSEEEVEKNLKQAMNLSYALLYWLQTEVPRPDGGTGWPGLRLRGDLAGTEHGLAKRPYIREARRILAEFTVTEKHVGLEQRMQETGLSREEVFATPFADSVGVGSYRIDLHPSTGGDNYIDIGSLPFQIPLGALIPQRMENLMPASKNLGVTHITNGCYRLHPVEWNIGESVGMLAAYSTLHKSKPRDVRNTPSKLEDFQRFLVSQGIELQWPDPTRSPR